MQHIRNIAIIAHVDHGKTTLVDCLLKQSGTFRANQAISSEERIMDSMDLEREKGITIKAKNAAFKYKDYHINIVDTPGHADFGGEVERIMNMIDGVLLVVDAADGPQAQTRFVLRKALEAGAKPIVVINKIDRENAEPHKVLDQVVCIHGDGRKSQSKITAIYHFEGLKRIEITEAHAGDVVGLTGFEDVFIGETITDTIERQPLPFVPIDPPTIQMEFAVNDGPLAGQDGKLVTARHIRERLIKETRTNVAIRVADTEAPNIFTVSGRGEMQIAILVEQMRREGYEVLASRPEVIYRKDKDGNLLEQIEKVFLEIPKVSTGDFLQYLAVRN